MKKKSRQTSRATAHVGKSVQEREAYRRFISSTRGKASSGTDSMQDEVEKSADTYTPLDEEHAKRLPTSRPHTPTKKPYRSWATVAKQNIVAVGASSLVALILGTAVVTLWNLNREVGELDVNVTGLQDKYKTLLNPDNKNQLNITDVKTQLEKDLQAVKDRVLRLEIKVFE